MSTSQFILVRNNLYIDFDERDLAQAHEDVFRQSVVDSEQSWQFIKGKALAGLGKLTAALWYVTAYTVIALATPPTLLAIKIADMLGLHDE